VGVASLKELSLIVTGTTINLHRIGITIANAKDTTIGLTTVIASNASPPRFEITWTMIRPTTSSIIAALVKTTPRRVAESPLVPRIVNVVPRLVEQSAAPAEKACNGVALSIDMTAKEKPIGSRIPVVATIEDKPRLALRDLNDVDSPPVPFIR
jgi:hypothetical protein